MSYLGLGVVSRCCLVFWQFSALLFTTGLIGIFGLWSFSCAFNVGGAGFFVLCVCVAF